MTFRKSGTTWNVIPKVIRDTSSLQFFKGKLKNALRSKTPDFYIFKIFVLCKNIRLAKFYGRSKPALRLPHSDLPYQKVYIYVFTGTKAPIIFHVWVCLLALPRSTNEASA